MVVIRDCDDMGYEIHPVTVEEKSELRKVCLNHARRPDGSVDWEAF